MNLKSRLFRKAAGAILGALIFAGGAFPAFAAPTSMQEKLIAIEEAAYGTAQTGALIDRVNRLENEFTGTHPGESVSARVDKLYAQMFDNSAGPSIVTQMNAVEYAITEKLSLMPLDKSINAMELTITGKAEDGLYTTRIDKLAGYAFGADPLPVIQYVVPAATLVRVELVSPIDAKNIKVGSVIDFKVADDTFVDGMLVFPKGLRGCGTVAKVRTAKFGRGAQAEVDFEYVRAFDCTDVKTTVGKAAETMMIDCPFTATASATGTCLIEASSPIGNAVVKGKDLNLQPGTELYIQTKTDTILYGLEAPEAATRAAEREAERKAAAEAKKAKREGKNKDGKDDD